MATSFNYKAVLAGLGFVTVAGVLTGCWGNRSEKPPVHIVWNMDFQEKWDPQEETTFYADGRTARPPVEGTVARGFLKEDDLLWRGRDFDGRLADRLPDGMTLDAKLLARGRERYDIYCAPCHDQAGRGVGPAATRGGGFAVPPANLHQDRLVPMPLGYFYEVITEGKMPNMYPYAAQIPVEDRWAIAVWVRALQQHGKGKGWAGMPMTADASAATSNTTGMGSEQ
jgi:mono/diheme cytochrome c family protein